MQRISPRPLLILHGRENGLHKAIKARSLYDHASEPKQLHSLEEGGQTGWKFDENPTCKKIIGRLEASLGESLNSAAVEYHSIVGSRALITPFMRRQR